MTWAEWFPGEDPDRVGFARVWAEAARRALAENRCQIGWLGGPIRGIRLRDELGILGEPRTANGYAQREYRRVFAPRPTCASNLMVLLHEVGHIATDFRGATEDEREAAADAWALEQWRAWELPDAHLAEFRFSKAAA